MKRSLILLTALAAAGCAQLPPTAADIQAKRFDPLADKAVVYVVRPPLDSSNAGYVVVDSGETITTMSMTYMRIELRPGTRYLEGSYPPSARLTLNAEAGKIYFVRHTVTGERFPSGATLQRIDDQQGRAMVTQATMFP